MNNRFYHKFIFVLILCTLQISFHVEGQDRWSLITSCDLCPSYRAVTYGDGKWVTVGDNGQILTSIDAINWTNQKSNTTENLTDIVYASGRWVVVGSNGITLTSLDLVNWTTHPTDPANSFNSVAYGNGQWIAVGRTNNVRVGYSVLFTSVDGITWADQPVIHGFPSGLNGIRYLNGTWYAVGGDGLIIASSNGTNWTIRNSKTNNSLNAIEYGGGQFLVCTNDGNIVRSSNGIEWSAVQHASQTPIFDLGYGDGRWVIVTGLSTGSPLMYISSDDGSSWKPVTSPATNSLNSVYYNSGRWVSVGRLYSILVSPELIPLSVSPARSSVVGVYPNPSSLSATVQSDTPFYKIMIRSATGLLIEEHVFTSPVTHWYWENSELASGSYIIQTYSSDQTMSAIKHIKK